MVGRRRGPLVSGRPRVAGRAVVWWQYEYPPLEDAAPKTFPHYSPGPPPRVSHSELAPDAVLSPEEVARERQPSSEMPVVAPRDARYEALHQALYLALWRESVTAARERWASPVDSPVRYRYQGLAVSAPPRMVTTFHDVLASTDAVRCCPDLDEEPDSDDE